MLEFCEFFLYVGMRARLSRGRFVEEIGWKQPCVEIYCDNQSALKLMKNPKYHAKTKHISVQYHFLRELIEEGEIKFIFVGTNLQCADFLT